jgi:hypothetical protein
VREVRGDGQHLARLHHDLLRLVLAQPEVQRSREHVRELLVLVRVAGHQAALLEVDVREHHPLAGDEPPVEQRVEALPGQVVPAVVAGGGGHLFLLGEGR